MLNEYYSVCVSYLIIKVCQLKTNTSNTLYAFFSLIIVMCSMVKYILIKSRFVTHL